MLNRSVSRDSAHSRESEPHPSQGEVTRLLAKHSNGEADVLDRLIPLVYEDLRAIAHRRLRSERVGHTLSTTGVVHEAYLRLVNQATVTWQDRAHFFAVAAGVIRRLLIDYARARNAEKRGGRGIHVEISDDLEGEGPTAIEVLAVDEALGRLARYDARLERVVECRFFGGMTVPDTARALGISQRTAERDWVRAKAYLFRALRAGETEGP